MLIILIRTIILYLLVVLTVRVMGKRQIGQMQPAELVITILISEVAVIPMQDKDLPLMASVIPLFILISLEIFSSLISMKSLKFRSVVQGNSLIIIRNGELDQAQMKKLRLTVDDVLEALRKKDVFNIKMVEYAILETDGIMTVMLKPEFRPVINSDMKLEIKDTGFPRVIVSDGKIIKSDIIDCEITQKDVQKIIKKNKIDIEKVMLMTVDKNGKIDVVPKENKK